VAESVTLVAIAVAASQLHIQVYPLQQLTRCVLGHLHSQLNLSQLEAIVEFPFPQPEQND